MANIIIKHVKEHYEIWIDDEFYCSCDNLQEVGEEIKNIE